MMSWKRTVVNEAGSAKKTVFGGQGSRKEPCTMATKFVDTIICSWSIIKVLMMMKRAGYL